MRRFPELGPYHDAKDILELGIRISAPYNQADDYFGKISPYSRFIDDVYLSPPESLAATQRQVKKQSPAEYDREVDALADSFAALDVRLAFVFNAFILSSNHDAVLSFLEERLEKGWPLSAIFADVDLAAKVKKNLPEIKLTNSISANMISERIASFWAREVKADAILMERAFNLYPEKLAEIKAMGVEVKVIPNNACISECPFILFHSALPMLMETAPEVAWKEWDSRVRKCQAYLSKRPWMLMRTMIAPKNLGYFKGCIDIIKLDSRSWNSEEIRKEIERYAYLAEDTIHYNFKKARQTPGIIDHLRNCNRDCVPCGWCEQNVTFEKEELDLIPHLEISETRMLKQAAVSDLYRLAGRLVSPLKDPRLPVKITGVSIEGSNIFAELEENGNSGRIFFRRRDNARQSLTHSGNIDLGYNTEEKSSLKWEKTLHKLVMHCGNTLKVMEERGEGVVLPAGDLLRPASEAPLQFRYALARMHPESAELENAERKTPPLGEEDVKRIDEILAHSEHGRILCLPNDDNDGSWLREIAGLMRGREGWEAAIAYTGSSVHPADLVNEYIELGFSHFRAALWSCNEEEHDRRLGRKGNFKRIVEVLDIAGKTARAELWLHLADMRVLSEFGALAGMAEKHAWSLLLDLRAAPAGFYAPCEDTAKPEEIRKVLERYKDLLTPEIDRIGFTEEEEKLFGIF